jgi:hypothetical protein
MLLTSYGLRGTWSLKNTINNIFIDVSSSARQASIAETPLTMEQGILDAERHILTIAGLEVTTGNVSATFHGFFRTISSPIFSRPIYQDASSPDLTSIIQTEAFNSNSRTVAGLWLEFQSQLLQRGKSRISVEGSTALQFSQTNGTNDETLPLLYGTALLHYEYLLGTNSLRAGLRLRASSSFIGQLFIPQTWSYITDDSVEPHSIFNGLDFVSSIKVGNAFLRFSIFNILDNTYYAVPTHPMFPRHFRFSFAWAFLD